MFSIFKQNVIQVKESLTTADFTVKTSQALFKVQLTHREL